MPVRFRTPLTYYGGKQKLLQHILPRIPEHSSYIEPFVGGGAVFWAKGPADMEVLNDTNRELMNFYRVVQQDYVALEKEIKITLHSRDLHRKAWVIYTNPDMFNEIKRAWAVWMLCSQSFSSKIDGSWGYDKISNSTSQKVQSHKERFTEDLAIRLQNAQLECADALYVIKSRDDKDAFFYCDPPYYNSDCGHYDGYSLQDFENLLVSLSEIKGKFLLSSYPSPILVKYAKKHGWSMFSVDQRVTVNNKGGYLKRKIEVLTANFKL